MNPAFLNMYMGFIFTYAFSSGGYDVAPVEYKAGQYTRWSGKGQNGKGASNGAGERQGMTSGERRKKKRK